MSKKASLLWMDLEMTGLDPSADEILEVAAVATGFDLKPMATYEGVVKVDPKTLDERINKNAVFWDANKKARDALIKQNSTGKPLFSVQEDLTEFITEHFNLEKPIYLAGNSVHMDQKFIEKNWPNVAKLLHYRILDVSAWKIIFENVSKKRFIKPESHRALKDIEGSIEELRFYMNSCGALVNEK